MLGDDGFLLVPGFLAPTELGRLREATEHLRPKAGLRNPPVQPLPGLEGYFLVRSILFDKTAEHNWKVPWHQDLTIAVKQRVEVPGFGPWSEKDGLPHVQPPVEVLREMVTLRLHLDACGADNGPLRVLPGTHRAKHPQPGLLARDRETVCILPAGGALLMSPLLVHASSPVTAPGRRRVLHLEFAREPLPHGLEWVRPE